MKLEALARNTVTNFSQVVSAAECNTLWNPKTRPALPRENYKPFFTDGEFEKKNIEFRSLRSGKPFVFHKRIKGQGNEKGISEHFAFAAGYADVQEHLFDRKHRTVNERIEAGAKVVLSLNFDLSYRQFDFRDLSNANAVPLENWMESRKGEYISVSIRSAADAIKTIRKVVEFQGSGGVKNIYSLYRGGVIPYADFFISGPERDKDKYAERHKALFDGLHDGISGMPIGLTRAVGAPRLVQFIPTQKFKESKGGPMRGNFVNATKQDNTMRSGLLIFADEDAHRTPEYGRLQKQLLDNEKGVYVLASPWINVNLGESHPRTDGKPDWKITRWIINDIGAQTFPVGEAGQRRRKQEDSPDQSPPSSNGSFSDARTPGRGAGENGNGNLGSAWQGGGGRRESAPSRGGSGTGSRSGSGQMALFSPGRHL